MCIAFFWLKRLDPTRCWIRSERIYLKHVPSQRRFQIHAGLSRDSASASWSVHLHFCAVFAGTCLLNSRRANNFRRVCDSKQADVKRFRRSQHDVPRRSFAVITDLHALRKWITCQPRDNFWRPSTKGQVMHILRFCLKNGSTLYYKLALQCYFWAYTPT